VSGTGQTLSSPDIHAHNSFDRPNEVQPRDVIVKISGAQLTHEFPPASVTRLELSLG
jgi:alpha-L-arabinofuranosidase